MAKKRRKFTQCPNCGYTFEEANNYCPNCGQENHDLNVPVKHLIAEFFEGTLHFDTKAWRTLKCLILRPGLLTEKFNIGQRASYVPPFRLYVFISLIFFFVLALSKSTVTKQQEGATTLTPFPGVNIGSTAPDSLRNIDVAAVIKDSVAARLLEDSATAKLVNKAAALNTARKENLKWAELETQVEKFAEGGEASKQKLLKNTSFMMFLLMPFFAYLLYLFYYKKRRNYVEHLMFSIHLHTFYFLLIIAAVVIAFIFPDLDLTGVVIFIMLLYLYFALKQVYKTSYVGTFLKLIPISFTYVLTLTIFLLGTLAISILLS